MTSDPRGSDLLDEVPGVLGKLETTRRELDRLRFWAALAKLLLAELALYSALVLFDWIWVLPFWVRAACLAAMVALAAFEVFRGRFQPGRARADAAAVVEAGFPELGQRLRTVVEYAAPTPQTAAASPALVQALARDTEKRTEPLNFQSLVDWARFQGPAAILGVATVAGLVTLFFVPGLRTAVLRTWLLPVHFTTMEVAPGNATVKAGDELMLAVTLSGRPVPSAHWSYRMQGSHEWISASLARPAALAPPARNLTGRLNAGLKDCQTDFDYRVMAGELESPTYHVKVVHPLVLKRLEAKITPPVYTRRKTETAKDPSFTAIEGSQVELALLVDHVPTTAALERVTADSPSRETIALSIDGIRLTAVLPEVTSDRQYDITARDDDGMTLETPPLRITVRPDEKPTLRFVRPEELLAVIPTTEVPIEVEATDDFGVARLGICYKVGDGPEETLYLADVKDQPVTARALATLYLEKHHLTYNDAVAYYAFVEDNHPRSPHRVVSELRFIDILPFKQAYELAEGGGTCSGSTTLEELIARQRVNLNRTLALERDASVDDSSAGRLAKFEEELAAATTEFAQGLSAMGGPVQSLDAASSAMQAATESLKAKELTAARPREEAALKALVSARQNLRKRLSQSSSSQASACRQFDQRQTQKIRRPPPDSSKKQLAQLENELQKLAEREQKFSEEIEPRGSGGPQLEPRQETEPQRAQGAPKQAPRSAPKPGSKPGSQRPGGSLSAGTSKGDKDQRQEPTSSPAEEQRQASQDAERLRQLARTDDDLTELTNRRLEDAAQAVQESSRALEQGQRAQAAQDARAAARKLESVARQVGALKARELAGRLARQRDIAAGLAKAERALGQAIQQQDEAADKAAVARRLAQEQSALAEEAAALADVLGRLRMAAAEEDQELARTIEQAQSANPPRAVGESMRRIAAAIGAGHRELAAQDAEEAARRLEALAADLESARRGTIGPQLERLLAAEKRAALLQERLRSAGKPSARAGAEKDMSELARELENLAPAEGALRAAAGNFARATQSAHGSWTHNDKIQEGEAGYFVPPVVYTESLNAAIVALQTRIQEIMLENALVERTLPVPPQYKQLVDDYYRVLSQDLR